MQNILRGCKNYGKIENERIKMNGKTIIIYKGILLYIIFVFICKVVIRKEKS